MKGLNVPYEQTSPLNPNGAEPEVCQVAEQNVSQGRKMMFEIEKGLKVEGDSIEFQDRNRNWKWTWGFAWPEATDRIYNEVKNEVFAAIKGWDAPGSDRKCR